MSPFCAADNWLFLLYQGWWREETEELSGHHQDAECDDAAAQVLQPPVPAGAPGGPQDRRTGTDPGCHHCVRQDAGARQDVGGAEEAGTQSKSLYIQVISHAVPAAVWPARVGNLIFSGQMLKLIVAVVQHLLATNDSTVLCKLVSF